MPQVKYLTHSLSYIIVNMNVAMIELSSWFLQTNTDSVNLSHLIKVHYYTGVKQKWIWKNKLAVSPLFQKEPL
jgi:hypothetical protein